MENDYELLSDLHNAVMDHMQAFHKEMIDEAYDFFFEEEDPEEFLKGTAFDLAFVNFEDWLVCDYTPREGDDPVAICLKAHEVGPRAKAMLKAMRESYISIYEVLSTEGGLRLKDLLLEREATVSPGPLPEIGPGALFGGRVISLGEKNLLGRCVYPMASTALDKVMESLGHTSRRYFKNKNTKGSMEDFLREESYAIHMAWTSCLYIRR